jgi:hypothetical protein
MRSTLKPYFKRGALLKCVFRYEVPEDWIRPYGVRTDPILIREVRFRMIDPARFFRAGGRL